MHQDRTFCTTYSRLSTTTTHPTRSQLPVALLGGFCNLAGKIGFYNRRSLYRPVQHHALRVVPDGELILTVTLSPRLHVDNGIKIWYLLGQLLYIQDCEELHQTSWRPTPVDTARAFPAVIPPAPSPSPNVQTATGTVKASPACPAGA